MNKQDVQTDPRLALLVRRFHTWAVIREQTVGEHTAQVLRLYLTIFGVPRVEVLVYVVKHDMGELQTGDPPYPIKAKNPVLKAEMDRLEDVALASMDVQLPELTPDEKVRFKFCDLLDCLEYAKNEVLMGNKYMLPVFEQGAALGDTMSKMSTKDQVAAALYCARVGVDLGGSGINECNQLVRSAYVNNFKEPFA